MLSLVPKCIDRILSTGFNQMIVCVYMEFIRSFSLENNLNLPCDRRCTRCYVCCRWLVRLCTEYRNKILAVGCMCCTKRLWKCLICRRAPRLRATPFPHSLRPIDLPCPDSRCAPRIVHRSPFVPAAKPMRWIKRSLDQLWVTVYLTKNNL